MSWYSQINPPKTPGQKLGVFLLDALSGPIDTNSLHTSLDAFVNEGSFTQIVNEGMQYVTQRTGLNQQLNQSQQSVIDELRSTFQNPQGESGIMENTGEI